MSKYYFLTSLIFLLSSCTSTPQVDDGLQIRIVEEELQIEIYDIHYIQNNSSSIKSGTITTKKKFERKKFERKKYDDKANLYCSKYYKKISDPVFYKGIGYYKCIEFN